MESQNCTSEVLALGKHQKVHEDLGPLSSRNKVLRLAQSFPQNDRLPRYGNPDLTQFQLNDVALFFLKYVWNIPADHFLSIARVWVVGLLCVNMVREYYDLIRGKKKSSKVHMYLLLGINTMEYLLVFTQGQGNSSVIKVSSNTPSSINSVGSSLAP